jgi:hypothetical protein
LSISYSTEARESCRSLNTPLVKGFGFTGPESGGFGAE